MTSPATSSFHLRAGAIKRVVRRGRTFLCGLCRSLHDQEAAAAGCLRDCWGELLSLDPVLPRRYGRIVRFRCRFCARDHVRRQDAARCAADCRDTQNARHVEEMALLALEDVVPPTARRLPRKATRTVFLQPAARPASKARVQSPEASGSPAAPGGPVVESLAAAAPASVEAPPVAAAAEAPAKKKPAKAFMRDGAEYVCTCCSKRFFTKLEVQACYDAH